MWKVSEMANILKEYAIQTSYEAFKNRRTAAAICADLLASYEERHIIIMLFREGLGECLKGVPYSTAYELSLAKSRVRTFARKFGLENQVIEKVVELIGIFADVSAESSKLTISEVLRIQRENDQDFELKKVKRASVEAKSDFDKLNCSETEILSISSRYQDEQIPSLKPFERLCEFSNFYPISFKQLSEINLQNMCELRFTIADVETDISIDAPVLEKLSINNQNNDFEQLSPLEKMLRENSHTLSINAPLLKQLELSHFGGFDISTVGKLPNLEVLIIRYTEVMDLQWLSGCKNLKKLHIYSEIPDIAMIPSLEKLQELYLDYTGITSLESIALFPNLRILSLRGNKISSIQNTEKLNHIKRIDLSRNPVSEMGDVATLSVPELILSDVDRELYSFDKKMNDVFRQAYQMFKSREKNLDTLAPFIKRSWMSKSETENYCSFVNNQFASTFFSYNPTFTWAGYDTKLKRQFLEFAREKYPFITISEEFEKQIQTEQFGISHYHLEKPGCLIYLNQSLYNIRVKLEHSGSGIDIRFANTSGGNLKKATIEKLIKEKCAYIDITNTKVQILVFDLFHTNNMDGVDLAIIAALHCLYHNISFPASTFIAGEYNKKGIYKKEKILSRMLLLAQKQGAKKIYFLTSGKKEQIKETNTIIEYCNDFGELQ